VVDHVKSGQVGELLGENEEEGIQQVNIFGDEVVPGSVQCGQGKGAVITY
jgi:hypothetical protein